MDQQKHETKVVHTPLSYLSIVLLFGILIAIPITIAYIGQQTRSRLRAAQECEQPVIPDPADCVGGQWQLYTAENNCVRFRCELP